MKKLFAFVFLTLFMVPGCSVPTDNGKQMIITMPSSMVLDQNDMVYKAKRQGIENVTANADGSLTYTMSETVYREALAKLKSSLRMELDSLVASTRYKSFKKVEYDENFTPITLTIDKNEYNAGFDEMMLQYLYFDIGYYRILCGTNPDEFKVTYILRDKDSGSIYQTVIYPDVMKADDLAPGT